MGGNIDPLRKCGGDELESINERRLGSLDSTNGSAWEHWSPCSSAGGRERNLALSGAAVRTS